MIYINNLKFYKKLTIKKHDHKESIKNILLSFIFGGIVSLIGEIFINIFNIYFDLKTSQILMSFTIIIIGVIMTGFGVYDKFGKIAYSAAIIPISGFANSTSSSAMDHKKEGFFLGICANLLKLSGIVISIAAVFGVLLGIIKYLINL